MANETPKNKLIIVSNRLPVTVSIKRSSTSEFKFEPSAGGLATALKGVHDDQSLWVGHPGLFIKNPETQMKLTEKLAGQNLRAVPLQEEVYQRYYLGMSNAAFWPLFHYFPQSMKIDSKDWEAYQAVNQTFAEEVLRYAEPGDRIWVHDYQLMLLPGLLRAADATLNIAYFHHVPFPSSEIFRVLPMRREILQGVLGADLIGFHTYDYARHFISSVNTILGCDVFVEEINDGGRTVKVGTFPIGIDASNWLSLSERLGNRDEELRKSFGDATIFLGIDRLDYTKGIIERLEAFQAFLRRYPDKVGKVVLVQVCVPSRTKVTSYDNLRKRVERKIGEIAGEFGQPGYAPVHYLYRGLPQDEIVALYRIADLMLVTPLRDGLNLVAKEFVVCSANPDAMLLLSEFAGAADEMGEALVVNPYDIESVVSAMEQSLMISREEKHERMSALKERVLKYDCHAWANDFIQHWDAAYRTHRRKPLLTQKRRTELLNRAKSARNVFVFSDYDGTLVPIVSRPEKAVPTETLYRLIEKAMHNDRVRFSLITGRSRDFCETHLISRYPNLNVAAEHGLFIYRDKEWIQRSGGEDLEKVRTELMYILKMHTRNVPGSEVEVKESTIVWHYRNANQRFARARVRMLESELRSLLSDTSLAVSHGAKILEIKPSLANKGHAVEHILENFGFNAESDLVLTIGDDTTDEDMFKAMPEYNQSICVGRSLTNAQFHIEEQSEVIPLLESLCEA